MSCISLSTNGIERVSRVLLQGYGYSDYVRSFLMVQNRPDHISVRSMESSSDMVILVSERSDISSVPSTPCRAFQRHHSPAIAHVLAITKAKRSPLRSVPFTAEQYQDCSLRHLRLEEHLPGQVSQPFCTVQALPDMRSKPCFGSSATQATGEVSVRARDKVLEPIQIDTNVSWSSSKRRTVLVLGGQG